MEQRNRLSMHGIACMWNNTWDLRFHGADVLLCLLSGVPLHRQNMHGLCFVWVISCVACSLHLYDALSKRRQAHNPKFPRNIIQIYVFVCVFVCSYVSSFLCIHVLILNPCSASSACVRSHKRTCHHTLPRLISLMHHIATNRFDSICIVRHYPIHDDNRPESRLCQPTLSGNVILALA
jgi:hypothetical protein